MLQQKIEVDIVEKREHQLTVFKKSSIDQSEDDQMSTEEVMTSI